MSNHLESWRLITDNKTVLNWLSAGVPLDFDQVPGPFEERNNIFKRKEYEFLDKEIAKLEHNGCISRWSVKPCCVSRISTVPKQDGSLRLVTDLRKVNQHLKGNKKFVYESIDSALDVIRPKDKLVTLDIKNGFFHCKVDPKFQTFLGFSYRKRYYV